MPDVHRSTWGRPNTLRGALALVVGPSGAGKDALINGARDRLGASGDFHFPRRVVTREVTPHSSEQHTPITDVDFDIALRSGGYFLHWQAHGKKYAIPSQALDELQAGLVVIANVSRTVLDEALSRVDDATIIQGTACQSVRRARLASRGRESPADIASRLSRDVSIESLDARLVTIDNSGCLAAGIDAMVKALSDIAERRQALRDVQS